LTAARVCLAKSLTGFPSGPVMVWRMVSSFVPSICSIAIVERSISGGARSEGQMSPADRLQTSVLASSAKKLAARPGVTVSNTASS
jgi:hypothetical protein